MRSSTLKLWTVGIAAGAAAVVLGLAVASSPAFGEESPVIEGEAEAPAVDVAKGTAVGAPGKEGVGATGEDAAPKNGEAPGSDTLAATKKVEPGTDDASVGGGGEEIADPFAIEEGTESDTPATAAAFDENTTKTDFQCAPPALSPAGLLAELDRSRRKQEAERKKIERLREEIVTLRGQLTMQAEALEKRLAVLATEEVAAKKRVAEEKKAKKDAVAAVEKAKKNGTFVPQMSEEERAAKRKRRLQEVDRLAAATKGMQPTEAARFLGALDMDLAADVVARMKPKLAGQALAKMKPKSAAKIAARIVEPMQ